MSYVNAVNNEAPEVLTILVETLTGTTFEVKVSPQDRVKSIKSKIQKVEGIPISHQHLLYKSKELQDSSCVTEPSVALHDRATVKLVLSMRGGPISLVNQAVPLNKAILKNLVKLNRDEMVEDLPPGCKIAILVLRVGDQLNLLHVVEDLEDSPEASSSKDSLYFDSLEGESSKRLEENSVTMEKVSDLKEKMGKLSLQRKSIKVDCKREEISPTTLYSDPPGRPGGPVKLPSISHQVHGEMFKSRSEFSQVPILPDIIPQNTSRDLEFISLDEKASSSEMCETIRPKTCPGSLRERQFYNIFEDDSDNSLHIAQPHFRSCVSACASKVHHEWGGGKTLLQSLNILPPIPGVPDVLNNHTKISRNESETRNLQTTAVPTIEKLNLHHRNLSSTIKLKQNSRKKSQPSFSKSESVFFSRSSVNYSEAGRADCFSSSSSSSRFSPSTSTVPLTFRFNEGSTSFKTFRDQAFSEVFGNKAKTSDEVESLENDKKINVDKKSRLRCCECKKRLSLTGTFECRCGFAFCSFHRYSEAHQCTYDYKKESRKMLEQANPSVVAPKLPKI